MKIGFITTHLGIFGSIRELIENANELTLLGHDVTIYNDTHNEIKWLPCLAKVEKQIDNINVDALIMMDSPFNNIFKAWRKAKAKFKTFVMMGFDPDGFVLNDAVKKNTGVEKNLKYILENYVICADGQWQIDYFKEHGIKTGVSIGGINLRQFKDLGLIRDIQIGYSGDLRPRKGGGTIKEVVKIYDNTDYYFGRGDQKDLVEFLNRCEIFIDNHLRAGWCNPILEALACGCVVVCNRIPASRDFAINGKTAITLKDNSVENFENSIDYLLLNPNIMDKLKKQAKEHVKKFDYKIISKNFSDFLSSQV